MMMKKIPALVLLILVMPYLAMSESARKYFTATGEAIKLPFSDGVLVNGTLYLSGHIGVRPGTTTVPADIDEEVKLLLEGMKTTLGQADMTMQDLVYVQVFCSDVKLYSKFNSLYTTYFTKDFPARAFIGSGPLLFGAHFEMQGIAVKEGASAIRKSE